MATAGRRDVLRALGAAVVGAASLGSSSAEDRARAEPLTRPIGGGDERLPLIGLGTWQTFDVSSESERAPLVDVLRAFVELGGRLIDCSPMYGRAEDTLGALVERAKLRKSLYLATKVWTKGKQAGVEQMRDSMRKLGADPIDLMQVHNLVDVETHLATLAEWKREGRVRHVGVTHYAASAHAEVARILERHPVDFVQINYSVGEREAERTVLPAARERKIAVIANRPFGGGALIRGLRDKPLPDWAAEIDCASWAQVLLKFVVSHPAVTCAIPATSKVAHLRDDMMAGRGRMPDESLRARIAASV